MRLWLFAYGEILASKRFATLPAYPAETRGKSKTGDSASENTQTGVSIFTAS